MSSQRGENIMGLDAGVARLMFWDPSCVVGSPYNDGVCRFMFCDPNCVVDSPYHDQCDVILPFTEVQQGEKRRVS
jgi:hypothetical protein